VNSDVQCHVRPSGATDIPTIQAIARQSWDATYRDLLPEAARREYLAKAYDTAWLGKLHARPDLRGFLALEDDRPAGFAMMSLGAPDQDPPGAVLRSLYLAPATQGKGHGTRLLEAVKQAAREAGNPLLWVAVHVDLTAARAWYEKQGFVYDGPASAMIGSERIRQAVYKLPLR